MKLSRIGKNLTAKSGILELMDDLGNALASGDKLMLGGGNPAIIPEVTEAWKKQLEITIGDNQALGKMLSIYDTPQGNEFFIEQMVELMNSHFSWNISKENIAITSGSQSAFFTLFNMFGGLDEQGSLNKILLPIAPEYIGYANQGMDDDIFHVHKPTIELLGDNYFKYHIDFDNLPLDANISAICLSRPTNPSGNVVTDEEIKKLHELAQERGIPLIIDNAYGTPFPCINFTEIKPYFGEGIISVMSLSKLGLPNARNGIIIADKDVIQKVRNANAIQHLSIGTIGQTIVAPLIKSNKLLDLCEQKIRPYYQSKKDFALKVLRENFDNKIDYRIHLNEGTMFFWLWFPSMKMDDKTLYQKLKGKGVIIVPGSYFFYALQEEWDHTSKCVRINYSYCEKAVIQGLEIIANTLLNEDE